VTGDASQSDLPGGPEGLREALGYLNGVEGVGIVRFSESDVVRHPLVSRIVAAYDAHDKAKPKALPLKGRGPRE
jgi:phosphate starvation-inducible PhoH-like protein